MEKRDAVVDAVRADLLTRSQAGIAKYGTTLERTDLSLLDWLQHAYEETLDQANYLKRAIMELDAQATPKLMALECPYCGGDHLLEHCPEGYYR